MIDRMPIRLTVRCGVVTVHHSDGTSDEADDRGSWPKETFGMGVHASQLPDGEYTVHSVIRNGIPI